jgi:hypothetical protein
MEIRVKSIEEYKQAKAKGCESIVIDGGRELLDYVRNDIKNSNKINLAKKQGYVENGGNLAYTLDSMFNFGKHKGNQLNMFINVTHIT